MNIWLKIILVALWANVAFAQEFWLTNNATGEKSGPFEFLDGASIVLSNQTFVIQKILTDDEKVVEKMKKIVIANVEWRQASIDQVINFLVKEMSEPGQGGRNGLYCGIMRADRNPAPRQGSLDDFASFSQTNVVPEITLSARHVSLFDVMEIVTKAAGLTWKVDGKVVVFQKMGGKSPSSDSPLTKLHYSDSVMNVVIPHIALSNATIEQAVATVQELWREQIPGKQLPLSVILRYITADTNGVPYEGYPGHRRTISIEARNVLVKDCLRSIAVVCGHKLRLRSGMVVFDEASLIIEDWITEIVPVSKNGKDFLGLSRSTGSEDMTDLLASYGVPFPKGANALWNSDVQKIIITTSPSGVSRLEGLLWLVDNGFDVRKVAQPTGDRHIVPTAKEP
jgi:hypothetical protein